MVDSNSDGWVHLLEYGLTLSPDSTKNSDILQSSMIEDGGDSYLALTFKRRNKAVDLTYTVEVSGDLINWAAAATEVGVPTDHGDGTETVTVRDIVPADGQRRFIRLRISH